MSGTSNAIIGTGTTITIDGAWADEEVYILDVTPPAQTRDKIDTSHMGTRTPTEITDGKPGQATSLPTKLIDPGEGEFEIAFDPSLPIPIGVKRDFTINFSDGTKWEFEGFIKDYSPKVPLEDRMTATVSIRATGKIDITPEGS